MALIRPNSDSDGREGSSCRSGMRRLSECQGDLPLSKASHSVQTLSPRTWSPVWMFGSQGTNHSFVLSSSLSHSKGNRGMKKKEKRSISARGRLECSFSKSSRLYGHTELSAREWEGINCSFTALSKVGEAERDNSVQCPNTNAYRVKQTVGMKTKDIWH